MTSMTSMGPKATRSRRRAASWSSSSGTRPRCPVRRIWLGLGRPGRRLRAPADDPTHHAGLWPVGLAGWLLAWIVEKYRSWSDCDGVLSRRFSDDFVLTQASLYWFTNTIATSFRPYYEHARNTPGPAISLAHTSCGWPQNEHGPTGPDSRGGSRRRRVGSASSMIWWTRWWLMRNASAISRSDPPAACRRRIAW
jgi:hypothetical protein